jgi:hypothetical protein
MDLGLIVGLYLIVAFLILAFNYGAHKNDQDDYEYYTSGSSLQTNDAIENVETVLVADDDFIEHLREMGFDDEIELEEALIEWDEWAAENLE